MALKMFSVEWFKMIGSLFLPHEHIKYFPPDYTIRDPFVPKIERAMNKGDSVYALIYDIKEFRFWFERYTESEIEQMINHLKLLFKKIAPRFFSSKEILFTKLLWGDDFLLVVRSGSELDKDIKEIGLQLCQMIEKEVKEYKALIPKECSFHFGYAPISIKVSNLPDSYYQALYAAHAMAKKKIAPQYHHVKSELRYIIEEENIEIVLEPIVSLKGSGLEGYEMLTRGPANTMFNKPSDLFNMAESSGLLLSLELAVFRKVIQEVAEKAIDRTIFINVTAYSLLSEAYLSHVQEILKEYPSVSVNQLVMELTGRDSIRDLEQVRNAFAPFRELGIRLAIGNTGAGYAPLMVISELLPEFIKIDRAVITNIDQKLEKETMLHALIFIADKINAKVIAEGIERFEELELLLKNRVHFGQGYFFFKELVYHSNDSVGVTS